MSDSIKALALKHGAKKPDVYTSVYEEYFSPLRERKLAILELGILKGGSLKLWAEYFPNATVTGLDMNPVSLPEAGDRIRIYQGQQQNTVLLDRIREEVAPDGFDIIIDDASHFGYLSLLTFWHLFDNHLVPGGLYAIEDWGTGYWPTWPDGGSYVEHEVPASQAALPSALPKILPSHQYGMVGFLKQLVDECHHDAIRDGLHSPPNRRSKFERLCIYAGLAMVRKAADTPVRTQTAVFKFS
jgi:SAM-dependent methyltransferase